MDTIFETFSKNITFIHEEKDIFHWNFAIFPHWSFIHLRFMKKTTLFGRNLALEACDFVYVKHSRVECWEFWGLPVGAQVRVPAMYIKKYQFYTIYTMVYNSGHNFLRHSVITWPLSTRKDIFDFNPALLETLCKHRWFSGRMLACHAGGPGSIPGRCNLLLAMIFAGFFYKWGEMIPKNAKKEMQNK